MRFLSICSGIEAASVASNPLGWEALAFSEIEPFPRAVLQHHYPDVPLHGDFTELKDQPWIVDADLLCGGTPCQAFSVAGLRKSLSDDRGNLSLQFIHLADAIDHLRSAAGRQPAYIVWENVPGVLSTNDNAFGAFLGGLCGRDAAIPEPEGGWTSSGVVDGPTRVAAWRTMDAQFFGVAQRRRRIFVLAHGGAGKWAAADALLPITEGMSGNPPPSRAAGERPAPTLASRARGGGGLGTDTDLDGGLIQSSVPEVSSPLRSGSDSEAAHGKVNGTDRTTLIPEVTGPLAANGGTDKKHGFGMGQQDWENGFAIPVVANPLTARMHKGVNTTMDEGQTMVPVAFKMRGGGNGTGERGGAVGAQGGVGYLGQEECAFTLSTTEDQHVAVPFAFKPAHFTRDKDGAPADIAPPLSSEADKGDQEAVVCVPASLSLRTRDGVVSAELGEPEVANALRGSDGGRAGEGAGAVFTGMAVRRLTPTECSRLQGFPDDYLTLDRDADAVEARSREVLRKLWCALGKEKNALGGLGEYAPLLSPEILLTGMSIGWVSREVARWCVEGGGEVSGANTWPEEAVRIVRVATEPGSSPYRREPIEQLARELGRPVSVVPYETPSWGQSLLDTGVRQTPQGPQLLRQALSAFQAVGDRRGKPVADGPRYKALGNSWAVPNMRWIFRRIQKVEDILKRLAA